jgi:hypothetical protein
VRDPDPNKNIKESRTLPDRRNYLIEGFTAKNKDPMGLEVGTAPYFSVHELAGKYIETF